MSSIYMIGNSLTDQVNYSGFDALVESQGEPLTWGRHTIPGAPIDWILTHPNDGFQQQPFGYFPQAFSNYSWDFVTLQPFDRLLAEDMVAIDQMLEPLETTSPEAKIFIYAQWPLNNGQDWDTQWLRPYTGGWDGSVRTQDYYETLVTELNTTNSVFDPFYLIPVGHVMYELNQRMEAGLVPGYDTITQLYTDNIHLNSVGSYIVATTFYATIFQDSPIGLPIPSQFQANATISTDLAAIIQDTVWDVVTTTPLTGVSTILPLDIRTTGFPLAIENQPYTQVLEAVGGVGTYTWELASGTLPIGLTLSRSGVLSGTPTATGLFDFTLKVTDENGSSVQSPFSLISDVDSIPQITSDPLPEAHRGSLYQQALEATSGNGSLSWELVSGDLPSGMTLRSDGWLVGTPGLEGDYSFTVRVTDADATPDSDIQTVSLRVGAPEANTLLTSRTLTPMTVDGAINESGWGVVHSATRTAIGSPNNTMQFGTLWDNTYLYVAVQVTDSSLRKDSTNLWDDDAIEILIDAQHDRESVFNSDDRQIVVDINGNLYEQGGRTAGIQRAVRTTTEGYTVEMAIPWSNLGLIPTANMAIGFDVANDDDDNGGGRDRQLTWQYANVFNLSPNQFGNLLLIEDAAIPSIQGRVATLYVNGANQVVGNAMQAGLSYNGDLFSNTDGTANPDDVIVGTSGADNVWSGDTGNDWIATYDGDDAINISFGNATIDAGAGADFVYSLAGDPGSNIIDLGTGNDNAWLQGGNNTVISSAGDNIIGLGRGTNRVTMGNGNDSVYSIDGSAGNNTIDLGGGDNEVWLEAGNNVITSNSGNNLIGLGAGTNTVTTGSGNDYVYSFGSQAGTHHLRLGNGTNTVWLRQGTNDIVTGNGNDSIGVGSGNDIVNAGAGSNIVYNAAEGGADIFVLDRTGFVIVYGFTVERDRLAGVSFNEVSIAPGTGNATTNTLIRQGNTVIAELYGVSATTITASSFTSNPLAA